MKKLNKDHLVGIACLLVAAVTYALAARLPKGQSAIGVTGPALFPNILATVLAASGVFEIIVAVAKGDSTEEISFHSAVRQLRRAEVINVLLIIALLILYVLLFEILGFVVTTFAFLFVTMFRLGVSIVRSIIYSAIYVLVIYLVFRTLFSISLPAGVLSIFGA